MITKQQALEFIYDLSQKTEVMLEVSCGEMQFNRIIDGDYSYTTFAEKCTFEDTVLKCIKENIEAIECLGIKSIPVDVDMLEVGQVYLIELDDWYDGEHSIHIFKYTGKKGETYCFESKAGFPYYYEAKDFYQLWRRMEEW